MDGSSEESCRWHVAGCSETQIGIAVRLSRAARLDADRVGIINTIKNIIAAGVLLEDLVVVIRHPQ